MDHWRVTNPNVQKMYARQIPVHEAISQYIKANVSRFDANGTLYRVSTADDYQQRAGKRDVPKKATSSKIISALNKHRREPREVLLWRDDDDDDVLATTFISTS